VKFLWQFVTRYGSPSSLGRGSDSGSGGGAPTIGELVDDNLADFEAIDDNVTDFMLVED